MEVSGAPVRAAWARARIRALTWGWETPPFKSSTATRWALGWFRLTRPAWVRTQTSGTGFGLGAVLISGSGLAAAWEGLGARAPGLAVRPALRTTFWAAGFRTPGTWKMSWMVANPPFWAR